MIGQKIKKLKNRLLGAIIIIVIIAILVGKYLF